MRLPTSPEPSLAASIIEQIERVVREAEESNKPLEVDPFRERLFELFVMADAADLTKEHSEKVGSEPAEPTKPDLTADGLCRTLGARWNLADALRESSTHHTRLPAKDLSRMRLLWSVMRMWMEWTYAWRRWPEFHQETPPGPASADA
jgi:hypothetical protein